MIELAGRIEASQNDEIAFMQGWLAERGEDPADVDWHHHAHGDHAMEGMATMEQMTELEASSGADFECPFSQADDCPSRRGVDHGRRIAGEHSGSAQDPVLFEFTDRYRERQDAEHRAHERNVCATFHPTPEWAWQRASEDAERSIAEHDPGCSRCQNRTVFSTPRIRGVAPGIAGLAEGADDDEAAESEDGNDDSDKESDDEPRPTLLDFANYRYGVLR